MAAKHLNAGTDRRAVMNDKPNSGTWVKGQSGNPSGAKKPTVTVIVDGQPVQRTISELARGHTLEALETLVSVMQAKTGASSDRNMAAKLILEFGWGKPKQSVEIGGPDGGPVRTEHANGLGNLSLDELRQLEALRGKLDTAAG
jgi:hypothetical protein